MQNVNLSRVQKIDQKMIVSSNRVSNLKKKYTIVLLNFTIVWLASDVGT